MGDMSARQKTRRGGGRNRDAQCADHRQDRARIAKSVMGDQEEMVIAAVDAGGAEDGGECP